MIRRARQVTVIDAVVRFRHEIGHQGVAPTEGDLKRRKSDSGPVQVLSHERNVSAPHWSLAASDRRSRASRMVEIDAISPSLLRSIPIHTGKPWRCWPGFWKSESGKMHVGVAHNGTDRVWLAGGPGPKVSLHFRP